MGKNDMLSILTSFAVGGVAGYVIKDKISPKSQGNTKQPTDLEAVYAENEKYARRNKELERENEDLLAEIAKLHKQARNHETDADDLEDALEAANREVKSLRQQNESLSAKLKDYKVACESLKLDLEKFKNK